MSYVMLESLGFEVGDRHVGIDPKGEGVEVEGEFSGYELGILVALLAHSGELLSLWNQEQGGMDAED